MRRAGKTFFKAAAFAVASVLAGVSAGQARADNLADALIGAYNTSGLLEQNRALLRAADEDVALALSALRPVITWTMNWSRDFDETRSRNIFGTFATNRTYSTGFFNELQISQLLWDGGAARLGHQAAQEAVLAARQQLLSIEQQVLSRAVLAYVNVLFQNENVGLRENNLRLLQEEQRAAQDRFDVGEVTRTDVALAESRVAGALSGLATARGNLQDALAEYQNAVGHAPGSLAGQPTLPSPPASVEAAESLALRNHPQILAVQHQVAAAELAVLRAGKAFGPTVSLSGEVSMFDFVQNEGYTKDASVSLTMQQRIYQGGAVSATHRQAMANRDASRANLLTVQKNIRQGVSQAYFALESARANVVATREQVRAAQVAFDGIREEATLGARTTLDVLTAEQNLLDAQTQQILAQGNQSVAAFELLSSQGLLTAERLGLAVQIYDPTLYYNLVKNAPTTLSKRGKDLDRVLKALGKK